MSGRDLNALLEGFLGAPAPQRSPVFNDLVAALKQAADPEQAAETLRQAILPTLEYSEAQTLHRLYIRLRVKLAKPRSATRFAVLSNTTTHQLTQFIELFLFAAGIPAEVKESGYGLLRQEILDPDSELSGFKPNFVFLATTYRDLAHVPELKDDRAMVQQRVDEEHADWRMLWQIAKDRLGCQIIQNNFVPPPWRLVENHEMRHSGSLGRYIGRINQVLADESPPYVTIHDVEHLAAAVGLRAWGDERFFHQAKIPCAPECLVDYAQSVVSLVAAQLGRAKKCLVLDLDNTLWGGVIGDDGLGGIRLGQGDAEGEAFQAFQRYAKGLRERGVILAVCSKNEDRIAREVFERHTEMVLRLSDISCFVANWLDKATNLRAISEQLNIGLNSLVFVDDNPAERSIVRQLVPEVAVPEIPIDPADYVQALARHRYFQTVSLATEDLARTEFYRANAARQQAEASVGSVQDYLRSLEMVARMEPVTETTLERTVQLIGRSNQFNLTTRRYSAAEVMEMIRNPDWLTCTVSLADRFGDNGLISVLFAKFERDALVIDTWLMSCRVLKRGVEDLLLCHLYEIANEGKLGSIRGEFVPSSRNGLVADHYARLGFEPTGTHENGHSHWELKVAAGWQPRAHFIHRNDANGT